MQMSRKELIKKYFGPQIPEAGIVYGGPKTNNPFEFRYYDESRTVGGLSMRDWLRFSVVYWHTFRGEGADPFGPGCVNRPWESGEDTVKNAIHRAEVAFAFMKTLGAPKYAFHDRDVAPEGETLKESNANLDAVAKRLKELQQQYDIGLLWGTANLFSNKRFAHGAATSHNAKSFAFAAAQVKKAIEVTMDLGGDGYTFWGGREGYMNLLNTDMRRELAHLGQFMRMAVDYKKEIGFTGRFYFEPKPKEPTKHQYDYDAAACINFLHNEDLLDEVYMNIETNHATLAGHNVEHELEYAGFQGRLGSVDANTGDMLLGWDTDQFAMDVHEVTKVVAAFWKWCGGMKPGGVNFDAKVRRESFEEVDLFHAHIGGMDTFAKALLIAEELRKQGTFYSTTAGQPGTWQKNRYSSYDDGIGAKIEAGTTNFTELEKFALELGDVDDMVSGRQELGESEWNRAVENAIRVVDETLCA